MAKHARRCSQCDINYPKDKVICPIHHEPTWELGKEDSHDADWAEQVARYERRVLPGQPRPNLQVQLFSKKGQVFVAHELLKSGGYLDCEVGDVIRLNSTFYELSGVVYAETDAEGWWLNEIPTEGVFDDATPEGIIGGDGEHPEA